MKLSHSTILGFFAVLTAFSNSSTHAIQSSSSVESQAQAPTENAGEIHEFKRQSLTPTYFSEGAAAGDLNNDGVPDVVYGPYWFAGPDYRQAQEIYPPKAQPMLGYADHFFAWVHDFDGDSWNDVLVVGFPGTPAYVYENPGKSASPKAAATDPTQPAIEGKSAEPSNIQHWKKHEIIDWVSNESPQWVDLTGDGQFELVCTAPVILDIGSQLKPANQASLKNGNSNASLPSWLPIDLVTDWVSVISTAMANRMC